MKRTELLYLSWTIFLFLIGLTGSINSYTDYKLDPVGINGLMSVICYAFFSLSSGLLLEAIITLCKRK